MQACSFPSKMLAFIISHYFPLSEYQEKISACKEKIYKAESETIADAELDRVQKDLEAELQNEHLLRQELR